MRALIWPCPLPAGGTHDEAALTVDSNRFRRLLIVPALFDEGNRMRRFTVEVMRRLDASGVDSFLPDLPGLNESLAPLASQTPGDWMLAMAGAAAHFHASHVLAIRGGALIAPRELPGWRHAAVSGASVLRQMLRARILASRQAGVEESQNALMARGRSEGLDLAGYGLGADFLREFQSLVAKPSAIQREIGQDCLGGPGLWLRAEPGEDAGQADALAAIIAIALAEAGDPQ